MKVYRGPNPEENWEVRLCAVLTILWLQAKEIVYLRQ